MKPMPHRLDAEDVDVGGQQIVESATQRFRWDGDMRVKVSYLRQRVNTGISPP